MRVALLVAVALLATACGHTADGRRLFARECAGCHSLTGREHGAMGGDLAIPLLAVRDLESFAAAMPTPDTVSAPQAHAIAVYVRAHELRQPRRG